VTTATDFSAPFEPAHETAPPGGPAPGAAVVELPDAALLDPAPFPVGDRRLTQVRAPALRRLLLLLDGFAIELAWAAALVLPFGRSSTVTPLELVLVVAAVTAAALLGIASQKLYRSRVAGVRAVEVARLGRVAALATGVAYLTARGLDLPVPSWRLAAGGATSFVLLAGFRSLFDARLKALRAQGCYGRPVVIVGANDEGLGLYRLLHTHPEIGFRISGVVGSEADSSR
jgi:FlaA1/EpsC-like NDP-sugar epimerase